MAEPRQEKGVQEVEKTELPKQQWRQEEEEMEEGETAVALQERRSRQPSATTIVVSSTGGVNVLFPLSEELQNGCQKHGQEALQESDKDGNGLEEDTEAVSGKNVYYDKDQGTESVDGFSVTENNGLLFSVSERSSRDDGLVAAMEHFDDHKSQSHVINHQTREISNDGSFSHLFSVSERSSRDDGLVAAMEHFDDHKSQSHVINHQTREISNDGSFSHLGFLPSEKPEISNDGSFSHLGFLPSEKSSEKHQTHKSCSDITVTFDDEQTVDIDRELTEFDVERVLEKQNTHDLYCPNCNSCITGRVILRKRKCSIKIPEEDKKRNKGQAVGASQLDASFAPAQNYQSHNTVDNSLDGSLIPEANSHHPGQEPEVFRCFSCFSFFIPTGSGFQLFKKFGDKSEKENIQSPQPISEVKKNWFSFLFSSRAETVLVAQGSGYMADVENSSVEASKEEIKSPHQSFDGQGVVKLTGEPQRGGDDKAEEKIDHVTESGTDDWGQNVDASPSTKPVVEYQNAEVKISHNGNYSGASQHATIGTNMSIHVEEPLKAGSNSLVLSIQDDLLLQDRPGTDAITVVQERPVEPPAAQGVQDIIPSAETRPFPRRGSAEAREFHGMDIIKSIVYGGLVESMTSLGVVLSAAGADATTLNILALGLANLIGGLFVVGQNLWELKNDHSAGISTETAEYATDQTSKQRDRYQELLGQRGKFSLHATFAILSYLIFGLLPPVIYGFSFRESENGDFKLIAVAASSLLCIILLATGKAYTQRPPRSYIKTVIYYVVTGFMASGVSYAAGDLVKKLLEKIGWLGPDSALTLTTPLPLQQQGWGAYQDH